MPATRGPSRAVPPRRQRSSLGPFAFLLFVAALVAGAWFVAKPAAEQAVVAYVAEHDTLLRQDIVRSLRRGPASAPRSTWPRTRAPTAGRS